MSNTLPTIDIIFKQKASSFVQRSERGEVILIVKDDTDKTFSTKTYNLITDIDVDTAKFTPENLQHIKDCMLGLPNKVFVIRVDTTKTVTDALNIVPTVVSTGWIGMADSVSADSDTIATWIKQQRLLKKTYKAVVFAPTIPPNSEGVVELANTNVTFTDSTRGTKSGSEFVSTLLGYLAGANITRSTTYLKMANLTSVVEAADDNVAIAAGKLVLINDNGTVKIGLGVNSLTTFDTVKTEDFSSIEVVEAMDLMLDDIRSTFKNNFIGSRNKYDYQVIFISAVNNYLNSLEDIDVLDNLYNNTSYVDIEAQRQALIAAGKTEAATWEDAKVRNNTYKKSVFLMGDVKILQSMANLKFNINMA